MAPARNGKRQASAHVEEPPHKKVAPVLKKYGVTQAAFKQMVEVLQHPLAGHLTEDCKQMILAMLPHSLCVPSDQREEVQNLAVKMFEEVVASVEGHLKEALEAEKSKVKTITDSKEQLLSDVSKAQEQLKDAEKDLEQKNQELTASSQAVVAAKTFLSKKEEEQTTGDASLLQTEADKTELQKAFEGVFLMVEAGESTDSAAQLKVFESAMKKLTMEESLKMAILPVLQKPPAERGSFDATVLSEFQNIFEAKLRELSEMLQQGAPERQARQLCVDQARAQLEEAETKQKECSGELLASKQKQKEATSALKEVEASVASYEATLKAAMDVQDEKQKDVDSFVETTMKGFTNLKDWLPPAAFQVLLVPVVQVVVLAERASDSYKTLQGVISNDPEEPFPVYASAQNRAEDMQRLSRLLKQHVDSAGPLQKYSHRFRESDKEYSEAAHGLFSSLKKFQESISDFRGKVADSNSEKIDTIKDKMSAKLPGVRGPHPQDEYSESEDDPSKD